MSRDGRFATRTGSEAHAVKSDKGLSRRAELIDDCCSPGEEEEESEIRGIINRIRAEKVSLDPILREMGRQNAIRDTKRADWGLVRIRRGLQTR